MKKVYKLLSIFFIFTLILTSCGNKIENENLPSRKYLFLSSVFHMDILDDREDKDVITEEVYERLDEIEKALSLHLPQSDISKVNQNAGKNPVKVSDDTISCIKESLRLSEVTKANDDGTFNIKIGPLTTLWNIGSANEKIPEKSEIDKALYLVHQDMSIDYENNEIYLEKEKMMLDLGGSAKGYATDQIVKILNKYNVENAIINLGGNIYILGDNDGKNFKVGVQNPLSERGDYLGIIECSNESVVTSGVYERYFEEDGKRYHHLLSDKTGYPVDNDLMAVSIISDNSMDADILSTSFYLLGLEEGLKKANDMEGVSSIFITLDNKIYLTEDLKENFILTEKDTFEIE